MTEQLHITQCDDPTYLPFAKTRIKAMRATGQKFLSQKFDVGGVRVDVRIEGEHSFVSISGGAYEYQVTPRSAEFPNGTNSAEGQSLVRLGEARAKYKNGAERNDGMLDWCSFDGVTESGKVKYGKHLVTWNCGLGGRYNPVYASAWHGTVDNYIRVDGMKIDVGEMPWGACRVNKEINGEARTYIVFATRPSSILVVIKYFIMEEVVDGVAVTYFAGSQSPPAALFYFYQPIYFCGRGEVFATLISTPQTTIGLQRFYKMTGTVSIGTSGTVEVGFDVQILPRTSFNSDNARVEFGGPPIINTFNEYIGVDVTADGDIRVIGQKAVLTAHMPGEGGDGGAWADHVPGRNPTTQGHYSWIETLDVNGTTLYSYASVGPRTSLSIVWIIDSYYVTRFSGELPYQVFYQDGTLTAARTSHSSDIYHIVAHDIDARYGTYVATVIREVGVGGVTRWGGFVPQNPDYQPSQWGPTSGPITQPGGNIDLVIVTPDGVKRSQTYFDGAPPHQHHMGTAAPMPGIGPSGLSTYTSGVALYSRRMASRRDGSFLASTVPWTQRGEQAWGYPGELTSNRVMTVTTHNGATRVFGSAEGALPDGNTEISLESIHPIF